MKRYFSDVCFHCELLSNVNSLPFVRVLSSHFLLLLPRNPASF